MGASKEYVFTPDYAVPPGETLLETIEALGMTQTDLAARAGRPLKTINEIIKGKASITPETALQLERVLGIPARFWNNRERLYQEAKARLKEQERVKKWVGWLKGWPIGPMANSHWIRLHENKVRQVEELLHYFGVASPEQWDTVWGIWQGAFRRSIAAKSSPRALAAWLRAGELAAQQIACAPFDETKFRESLRLARGLTIDPPERFQPELGRLCAEAGVAMVFIPEIPGAPVSGATRWLSRDKALIQLSLRYKTNDHLWFSFFHEAGHILCHGKRDVFLDWDRVDNEKEKEADRFASTWLIHQAEYQRFIAKRPVSREEVRELAGRLGIAPGIVVGRLQHDRVVAYSALNDLKIRLVWSRRNA